VLNGDIKHDFGKINEQEWREVKQLIKLLKPAEVIIVQGNHDVLLPWMELDAKIVKEYVLGSTLICHGNELPEKKRGPALKNIKTILIGHIHPCVVLRHGPRAEKYKCYYVTTRTIAHKRRQVIAMPSFGPLTMGVDVLRSKLENPLLGKKGRVFVVENDEVLDFGRIEEMNEPNDLRR
jgi:putative SbcD/Mre11-related phosphoesterase